MGACLEMRMGRKHGAFALLASLLALSGCGNDPNSIDYTQLGKEVISLIRTPATAQEPLADPASVLAQVAAPVILARPQTGGLSPFYLIGVRDNGPYRTYVTGTRQSFVFNRGIVTATRGAGHDLMAADINETLALISSGKGGTARRVMQYLDGEDVTRDLVLDCTITARSPGGSVGEDCEAPGTTFRNTYHVNESGQIVSSTQWISPRTGSVAFQVLRP